jgi:hypothetical protein
MWDEKTASDTNRSGRPTKLQYVADGRAPSSAHKHYALITRIGWSVTQSGRARSGEWLLEFKPRGRQILDPLMGWSGGADPLAQVRLRFMTAEEAMTFANRNGLQFEIASPHHTGSSIEESVCNGDEAMRIG